jgi:Zn-finger nucleic acid-binding protein
MGSSSPEGIRLTVTRCVLGRKRESRPTVVCSRCGPPRILEGMNCPRCKTPLEEAKLEDAEVRRCGACQGTWVPRAAFESAAETQDENTGWLAFELWRDAERFRGLAGELPCPGCGKTMVRLAYGDADVHVDVCPDCAAVWLDAQELERTVQALGKELARMDTAKLLGAAFEEAGQILREDGSHAKEWRHLTRVLRLLEMRVLNDHPSLRKLLMSLQGGGGFP